MTDKSRDAREQAEARFRKREEAARDGEAANAEHAAQTKATDDKTARLKAARLAKEAADKDTKADEPAATKKKR